MQASAQTLERIFDFPIQYRVPLFQRPYVWQRDLEDPAKDRLTPFWEDVRDTCERYLRRQENLASGVAEDELAEFADHFFGAVVLGKLDKKGKFPHHEVIDGQQRFTTAQLLVAAAHRLAKDAGLEAVAESLSDLFQNPAKHEPEPEEVLKLRPTQANAVAYRKVMAPDGSAGHVGQGSKGDDLIEEAYAFFVVEMAAWLNDHPAEERERRVRALKDVIRSHLKFVVIALEGSDNAQEIFESLNAQGTPLLAIDLVKNHVFRRAAGAGIALEKLDREVWRALDDKWWRRLQRQGRFERPRAELFLMHWLTMRKRDEVPATSLFVEFQRQSRPALVPDRQVEAFIRGFISDAAIYRSFEGQPQGSVARRVLDRFRLMDTTAPYPVVLSLFVDVRDGRLAPTQRDQALTALESWLVRRFICDYTTKNYNRTTVDLLRKIHDSTDPPHLVVIRHLRDATIDTEVWPTDDMVVDALVSRPLYNRVKPVRRVRMLLEACEIERIIESAGKAELDDAPAQQLSHTSLTVEHVLPQAWRQHWPLSPTEHPGADPPEIREAKREETVHMLGNLTLTTKKLNPSVGNRRWVGPPDADGQPTGKRAALNAHSILHLNRELVANHPENWDEEAIAARGKILAERIVKHWPGPEHWHGS